ncbi:MAG: glycine cleavage system aminomethyltransferase GcvT [Myxococcota bacterium]
MADLLRTPLYEVHQRAGARLVPFAGYEMPVQYKGVIEEHEAVRNAVGLFDVSHMGEVEIRGPKALDVAQRLVTNDVAAIQDGQAVYSGLLNEKGGFVDDIVVYRFSPTRIFICVNASNRHKDFEWMRSQARGEAEVVDRSDEFAQIAVQGPKAAQLVQRLTTTKLDDIKTYHFAVGEVAGVKDVIISRTGYTGEDGFELYIPAQDGAQVWDALMDKGQDLGVRPIGLGARDTLRLEMKYALYGNDIDDDHTPLEAGLGWIVKLQKGDFIGKKVLEEQKARGVTRKLVGLEVEDGRIARHGYKVVDEKGAVIGEVTSGTQSPSLKKAIAMAYVPTALSAVDSRVLVDIRGKPAPARVVKTPFLDKGKK